ncbi:AAA family ATPase [Methylorubrum zatmanii]
MPDDDARNPFRLFWGLGYRRLVPIVPPDAELSPTSSLARRPGSRGKAVGLKGSNGWYGFNWHVTTTTEDDLKRWHAMGAGVGIRTGEGLVALDIDSLSDVWARRVTALAHEMLGPAPRRLGRAPKALLPYRVRPEDIDAVGYRVVLFDDGTVFKPAKRPRVELLSTGRQFVCEGIHPDTGQPYGWPEGVPAYDELTEVSADQVNAFFAALAAMLPDANAPRAGSLVTDRRLVDQDRLRGDARAIAEAVARIPNDVSDYDGYRNMATALRGALPDDPETGLDIFRTWSERWEDGKPDPDFDERTFRSVQPPFALGAPYLYNVASRCAGEVLTPPELFFAPIADGEEPDTSAFGDDAGPGPGAASTSAIAWIDPASWEGVERPEQRWFVKGLVPHGEVTLLTGKGGIGKSLVTLQMLTAIALGIPFLGRETTQARVMGLFCEDGEDVLHARQKDICLAVMHDLSDLSANMRVASRKYEDNLLSTWDRSTSSMRLTKLFAELERNALAFGAKVVVLDTIADTFGGDEINRAQVRQFIQACAGRLAKAIDGAVILLGHPSRSGEQSGEGTSGSTAWHATVRSRLYLEETGKSGSGYRRLTSMKANYGPAGDSWVLKWQRGVLEPVSSSQTVAGAASEAGAAGMPETASVLERAVLKAVAEANADGVRMAVGKTSKFRVEPILRRRATDSLMAFTPAEVDEAVLDLIAKGQIVEAPMGRDASKNAVMTLTVRPPKKPVSVFD